MVSSNAELQDSVESLPVTALGGLHTRLFCLAGTQSADWGTAAASLPISTSGTGYCCTVDGHAALFSHRLERKKGRRFHAGRSSSGYILKVLKRTPGGALQLAGTK